MNTTDQIKHSMALAFFACAYADQADECEQPLRGEIMDQLPDTIDPAAIHAAETLAIDMERANPELGNIRAIYRHACTLYNADPCDADRELDPDNSGHYCAMQAMGTGVGLESFGTAVREVITVPYVEFGSYSLERDYFTAPEDDQ